MQNFTPYASHPRNPYRDHRSRPIRFNLSFQQRMTLGLIALFLCGIAFVQMQNDNGVTPPDHQALVGNGRQPRLKGGLAAKQLDSPMLLKVMTFNLRFASASDGYNSWNYRKDHLIDIINRYHPAIMGTQEGLKDQLAEIADKLVHPYERFGVVREVNGEYEQIFYDSSIMEKLESGDFWLSETPDTPGTKGWDAACVRLVTWGKFKLLATNQVFFFINTQLDHVGEISRDQGAKLLWTRIQAITKDTYEQFSQVPLFVVGDFNTYRHTNTYRYFTTSVGANLLEAWPEAEEKIGTVSYTYHGWAGVHNDGEKNAEVAANHIDWILFQPRMKVLKCEVITEDRNGRYPSDHYPIQAEFLFPSVKELAPVGRL